MNKLLLLIALLTSLAQAQDIGKVAGVVKDRATNEPLPGVNVIIKNTRLGGTTNEAGEYFILNVPPGKYELSASLIGYQTVTQRDVVVNINRTTTVDFALRESAVQADEVIITATRPDVPRERTSSSEVVRTEEVAFTPGIQNLTDVLALSADVVDGHFRGGREGEELYTLAGMGIVNPLTSASAFAPIVSAVEEVEVITSGFGAQFGNAQSGVVNISMKEGSSQKWKARAEVRTRVPQYKHWGNSVFDVASNPYLSLLDSPEKWSGVDSSRGGIQFFATLGYGFTSQYRDSAQAAYIAYLLWQQSRRDLNRKYDNVWDRAIDFNIGGPLSENATMFLAARVENEWPIVPPPEPDLTQQAMGNIVFDLKNGMTFRLSGAYTNAQGHTYRGLNEASYSDFRYWLWDRVVGLSKVKDQNLQIGGRFAHALSPSTFYDLKLNMLTTKRVEGPEVLDPNRFRDDISNLGMWRYYETPDFFRVGHMDNQFLNEQTRTISFDGSFTSQITNAHLVNAGVQVNFYRVDVNNKVGLSSAPQADDETYRAHPFEFAVFAQDKMEFESMIANVGLRLDVYNQNVDYYVDQFYPVGTGGKQRTPTIARLQPRIGISFPVSVSTVFHLNYGSFLQRPSFERTVYARVNRGSSAPVRLGNPRLLPQETNSYEVGVTQGLGEGFTLDVSGYYKDVSNLIERAFFFNSRGTGIEFYETFINRDYADIRGFRVALTKRRGWLTGSIKYNYSVATGKSSTPFDASPIFRENPNDRRRDDNPDPRDILLDFDRTHNVILSVGVKSPDEFGPEVLGFFPLENFSVSVKSTLRSGRPYTFNQPGDETGKLFNKRSPTEYNTDLKITKQIPRVFGVRASLYMEVSNLFNQKTYSYNNVFRNDINTLKYHTNESSLRFFDLEPEFRADQTFLIYGNAPRSYYLGIIIDL